MNSESAHPEQRCLRCNSKRIIHGHGGGSDYGDFVLNSEDQRKVFWRLQMGYLNFGGERTLCLDCGLVAGTIDPAKAKKMLRGQASDELLARLGLARKMPNQK